MREHERFAEAIVFFRTVYLIATFVGATTWSIPIDTLRLCLRFCDSYDDHSVHYMVTSINQNEDALLTSELSIYYGCYSVNSTEFFSTTRNIIMSEEWVSSLLVWELRDMVYFNWWILAFYPIYKVSLI